jgi:1,4-alpha-glucan branching enzyme
MARVRFQFRHAAASAVTVAGDFNGWSTITHPMERQGEDLWILEVDLPPGRHEYKFLVDGRQWWNDPEAPKVPNLWGSENSCVEIREEGPG